MLTHPRPPPRRLRAPTTRARPPRPTTCSPACPNAPTPGRERLGKRPGQGRRCCVLRHSGGERLWIRWGDWRGLQLLWSRWVGHWLTAAMPPWPLSTFPGSQKGTKAAGFDVAASLAVVAYLSHMAETHGASTSLLAVSGERGGVGRGRGRGGGRVGAAAGRRASGGARGFRAPGCGGGGGGVALFYRSV